MAKRRKLQELDEQDQMQEEPRVKRTYTTSLRIPMRDDGPDVSRIPAEHREEIRRRLAGPEVAPSAPVDPALVQMLVRAIASLEASILANRTGLTRDNVYEIVKPQQQLEEAISAAGARVLSKYNIFSRWADEVALVGLLALWQSGIFDTLRALRTGQASAPGPS